MDFDWSILEELRASYLAGSAGTADYWKTDSLMLGYDATFARRIAWKWQWVLRELDRRGWSPPSGAVLDYGCGTGVAAREVLAHYQNHGLSSVAFHDRSPRAVKFASEAVRREFPDVKVLPRPQEETGVLLVSHVLPELDDQGTSALLEAVANAQSVIFVEPGTHEVSRRLIALREKLVAQMHPVAPCVHAARCGLLTAENERHWCHFFVQPPGIVFTDSGWVQFGRVMGIDLRSLPLSFLVMDRRPPASLPHDSVRVLGYPRIYKGYMLLHGCDSSGVAEKRLMKRTDAAFFKAAARHRVPTLQRWETDGDDITRVEA